jgi:hypothetical protein
MSADGDLEEPRTSGALLYARVCDKGEDPPLLAEDGSFCVRATIDVPLIEAIVVPRLTWLDGEAAGPSFGLPMSKRDLVEELREPGSAAGRRDRHAPPVRGAFRVTFAGRQF